MLKVTKLFHFTLLMMFHQTASLRTIRQDCSNDELSRCGRPLQFFQTSGDRNFTRNREDLDKLCPDFREGLQCIGSYTRRCMPQVQRESFNKIYQGTIELVDDLCQEGDYQNEFLKHSPCLQSVKPLHKKCADRYQQTLKSLFEASANQTAYNQQQQQSGNDENDEYNVMKVCCSFREYLDCSEHVTRRNCGMETGHFIRGFLKKMSDSLMQNFCEELYKGSNHCPNEFSTATAQHSSSALSLISVVILATFTIRRIS